MDDLVVPQFSLIDSTGELLTGTTAIVEAVSIELENRIDINEIKLQKLTIDGLKRLYKSFAGHMGYSQLLNALEEYHNEHNEFPIFLILREEPGAISILNQIFQGEYEISVESLVDDLKDMRSLFEPSYRFDDAVVEALLHAINTGATQPEIEEFLDVVVLNNPVLVGDDGAGV